MASHSMLAVSAWEALFRAQVTVMRQLSREFPKELSLNEYDLLFNLSSQGGTARLKDLTERLLLSQPSVSRLVDRLVDRGLVEKCPDAADRRGAMVRLTEDGSRLYRQAAVRHAESIARVVGGALDDAQLVALRTLSLQLHRECPGSPEKRNA